MQDANAHQVPDIHKALYLQKQHDRYQQLRCGVAHTTSQYAQTTDTNVRRWLNQVRTNTVLFSSQAAAADAIPQQLSCRE